MSSIVSKMDFFNYLNAEADEARDKDQYAKMHALETAVDLWDNLSKGQEIVYSYTVFREAMLRNWGNFHLSEAEREGYEEVLTLLDIVGVDFSKR